MSKYIHQWQPYFTFFPMIIDGHFSWLEWINRRIYNGRWQYRVPEDIYIDVPVVEVVRNKSKYQRGQNIDIWV